MASAWATLAAYGAMMVLSYVLGQKHYNVPYNVKRIITYLVIAIIFSVITLYPETNYYMNTGLVLLFLAIVFLSEKKELKQLLLR